MLVLGSWYGPSLAVPQQALVGKCSGHQEQANPKSALEGSVTDPPTVKQQHGIVHLESHSANPEIYEFNIQQKHIDPSETIMLNQEVKNTVLFQ